MSAATKWLIAIAGLLAANVIAMVILAVIANNGTNQVIPDYYARAAHYDDELARSTASRALGWSTHVSLQHGALVASVRDGAGAIRGARVRITGYPRAHAAQALDVELMEQGTDYRASVPAHPGAYDLIVAVDARGAHYTEHVVVEAR